MINSFARPHFTSALNRLDILIHREILRLRTRYQLSLDEFRGLYVSDKQVDEIILSSSVQENDSVNVVESKGEVFQSRKICFDELNKDKHWRFLCEKYQLSIVEQEILLIAFVPELDQKYETLFAYLNNDVTRKYPTLDLFIRFSEKSESQLCRAALSDYSKLYRLGLLSKFEHGNSSYELQSGVYLSVVLRDFLLGRTLDECSFQGAFKSVPHQLKSWDDLPFISKTINAIGAAKKLIENPQPQNNIVLEAGSYSSGEYLLANLCAECGKGVSELNTNYFDHDVTKTLSKFKQILQLSELRNVLVLVDLTKPYFAHVEKGVLLAQEMSEIAYNSQALVAFVIGYSSKWRQVFKRQSFTLVKISEPVRLERRNIWRFFLSDKNLKVKSTEIDSVADFFSIDFKQIHSAVEKIAFDRAKNVNAGKYVSKKELFSAASYQSYSDIDELAHCTQNSFHFEQLILPSDAENRVREIISAIKNRKIVYEDWGFADRLGGAKGVMVMFSGASGTGKTMAASVIANEIGLDLYRIDLSRIVSKYIGETEKNLDKIFSAAKQANCILFFDEADALFGKRSDVKDAHDRYANVEVAYLLQKMEEHDGVVILTTNLSKNIDQAFARRLQYIIEFPRPDVHHRELIWRSMFNSKSPLDEEVDFNFLARQFDNTGGDIKNVVLDAAMLAADTENKKIDMPLLLRASARQMIKQGKVPTELEFKHYFSLVNTATRSA